MIKIEFSIEQLTCIIALVLFFLCIVRVFRTYNPFIGVEITNRYNDHYEFKNEIIGKRISYYFIFIKVYEKSILI